MIFEYIKRRLFPIFIIWILGYAFILFLYLFSKVKMDSFLIEVLQTTFWFVTLVFTLFSIVTLIRIYKSRSSILKDKPHLKEDLDLEFQNAYKHSGVAILNKYLFIAGFDCSTLVSYDDISKVYVQKQRLRQLSFVSIYWLNVVDNKGNLFQVVIRKKHLERKIKDLLIRLENKIDKSIISQEVTQMMRLL